jgi:hypothetical protein
LQELYNQVNQYGQPHVKTVCPNCEHIFEVELDSQGGFMATPSSELTRR